MPQGRRVRERVPAQSAMAAVVAAQHEARTRGTLARLAGVSPLTAQARLHYRAALGELLVGDILDGLGQRWDTLHDVPLAEGRTLDHLVMGPAGTFAVLAANYGGHDVVVDGDLLLASGEPHNDIELCVEQADAAADALSSAAGSPVPVQALLVVVAPRRLVVRREPSGVRVLASGQLHRALSRADELSSGIEVARLSDLADLETTWPAASTLTLDTQRLNREFTVLRAEVRSARVVRLVWGGVALVGSYALIWAAVATLSSGYFAQ